MTTRTTTRFRVRRVPGTGFRVEVGPAFGEGAMRLLPTVFTTAERGFAHVERHFPHAEVEPHGVERWEV